MGGRIEIEQEGCESFIHDYDCDNCATMMDVPDSERVDVIHWRAIDMSSLYGYKLYISTDIPFTDGVILHKIFNT